MRTLPTNSILIGDINLPCIDWKAGTAGARGRRLLDVVEEEGLAQLVSFPTHDKGNILDLVITNCGEKIVSVYDDGKLGNRDHCMIGIDLNLPLPNSNRKKTPNWTKADTRGMCNYLSGIKWKEILNSENIETDWQNFKNYLHLAVQKFVPMSTTRPENQPKWLNRDITKLIRKKKPAWKIAKIHRTMENLEKYKLLEKEVKIKIRNAKRNMEKRLAYSKEGNNARNFANYVKSKTKSVISIGPLRDGSQILSADEDMANHLNKFFGSVFSSEDLQNKPAQWTETEVKLDEIVITEKKILSKISKLKDKSAAGPDNISSRLLKTAAKELVKPLKIIYEKSMRLGQPPADWKHAVVAPIYKKGPKGEAGNYRPVSLTSIPCKLLESLIADHISEHLEANKLIRNTQHGFIKGRSCTTNLTTFLDKLTATVDTGKSADVFYLDFSKAFDKVPRGRLLQKLMAKGIDGQVIRWIELWLTGRTQAVRVGEAVSTNTEVGSGVPQGSVLGPILFYIFIDDIDECAEDISLLAKFADDTKGYQEISCAADQQALQKALDRLVDWAGKWCMSFNLDKCKIMHVGHGNPQHKYFMEGVELKTVEEEKDIGVLIHKSLKPGRHCEKVAKMARAVLVQLTRNFHFRDRHVFKNLYMQYVRPHLEFASPAWSPWLTQDIEILENVQRKAVNMISGLKPGSSYEEKCRELNIDTLAARRTHSDLVQAFKILQGIDRVECDQVFSKQCDRVRATRATADPTKLSVPHSRLEIRKNTYFVRVANQWNNLDSATRNAKTVSEFKRRLKAITTGAPVRDARETAV